MTVFQLCAWEVCAVPGKSVLCLVLRVSLGGFVTTLRSVFDLSPEVEKKNYW